jgi:cyclic beta-1,2-glucan synthetase
VLHLARTWLEQRLVEQGLSIEQLVQLESQNQAADQVSVSHSIASLRFLSAMDWKEFVETLSLVEATLRTDPAGVYGTMDFATRDRYRHAVESWPGTASSRKRRWRNKRHQLAAASAGKRAAKTGPPTWATT